MFVEFCQPKKTDQDYELKRGMSIPSVIVNRWNIIKANDGNIRIVFFDGKGKDANPRASITMTQANYEALKKSIREIK